MPRIDEVYPDKFLKAAALEGETVTYTIASAEMGKVGDKDKGEERNQIMLGFVETEKLLGLNKTNANMLGKLYGMDSDDWINQTVVLFSTPVQFGSSMVDAIRINEPLTRKKNQAKLKAATASAAKAAQPRTAEPAVREVVLAPDDPGASDEDIPF